MNAIVIRHVHLKAHAGKSIGYHGVTGAVAQARVCHSQQDLIGISDYDSGLRCAYLRTHIVYHGGTHPVNASGWVLPLKTVGALGGVSDDLSIGEINHPVDAGQWSSHP